MKKNRKKIASKRVASSNSATIYDRRRVGMVLIGMPGLQKRLSRYPQLYSRAGFVHQFRPLSGQELHTVIECQSIQLDLGLALDEPTDTAVVNAIARITGGHFRLVERLFAQMQRVMQINDLASVTTEVSGRPARAWSSDTSKSEAATNNQEIRPCNSCKESREIPGAGVLRGGHSDGGTQGRAARRCRYDPVRLRQRRQPRRSRDWQAPWTSSCPIPTQWD
jgi:hypothetical protein